MPLPTLSKCCKAPIGWETLGGMRVYQETRDGRRRVYQAQCSKCGNSYEFGVDVARAEKPKPPKCAEMFVQVGGGYTRSFHATNKLLKEHGLQLRWHKL